MDRAELEALRERVAGATGPDRELDALILCALLAPAGSKVSRSPYNGAWYVEQPKYGGGYRDWETPRPWRLEHASLTSSIDAAVALVERVLPGWVWFVGSKYAEVQEPGHGDMGSLYEARAVSGPLALVHALLSALLAQEHPHA